MMDFIVMRETFVILIKKKLFKYKKENQKVLKTE